MSALETLLAKCSTDAQRVTLLREALEIANAETIRAPVWVVMCSIGSYEGVVEFPVAAYLTEEQAEQHEYLAMKEEARVAGTSWLHNKIREPRPNKYAPQLDAHDDRPASFHCANPVPILRHANESPQDLVKFAAKLEAIEEEEKTALRGAARKTD